MKIQFQHYFYKWQFGERKQLAFIKQLYNLVKIGVPALDALKTMLYEFNGRNDEVLSNVATDMCANAMAGRKIGEGIERWFPYEVARIIYNSEDKGILEQGLCNVIEYYENKAALFKPFISTLSPLLIFILSLLVIAGSGGYLIPKISSTVQITDIPQLTRIVVSIGGVLFSYWYYILAFLIIFAVWCFYSAVYYDKSLYKLVGLLILPLYKLNAGFNLLRVLSMLVESGLSVPAAIDALLQRKHDYVYGRLLDMKKKVYLGEQNMGEVLNTGIFDRYQIGELRVIAKHTGEENFHEVFKAMSNSIAFKAQTVTKYIAVLLNLTCYVLACVNIVLGYAGFAFLMMAFQH